MKRVWENLRKRYRLVLYEAGTLQEVRRRYVRPVGVWGAVLGLMGLGAVLFWGLSLLVWGGPGGGKAGNGLAGGGDAALEEKVRQLEKQVEEQDSMRRVFARVAGVTVVDSGGADLPVRQAPVVEGGPVSAPQVTQQAGAPPVRMARQALIPELQVLHLFPPVDGVVSNEYGEQEDHFGLDLVADENALVRACADGIVIFSEYSYDNGHVIGIAHNSYNLISFYKHNSQVFKPLGSYVLAGEAIAAIGNTGVNSSGTHLHFELWYGGIPVNPADYLQFN